MSSEKLSFIYDLTSLQNRKNNSRFDMHVLALIKHSYRNNNKNDQGDSNPDHRQQSNGLLFYLFSLLAFSCATLQFRVCHCMLHLPHRLPFQKCLTFGHVGYFLLLLLLCLAITPLDVELLPLLCTYLHSFWSILWSPCWTTGLDFSPLPLAASWNSKGLSKTPGTWSEAGICRSTCACLLSIVLLSLCTPRPYNNSSFCCHGFGTHAPGPMHWKYACTCRVAALAGLHGLS